MAALSTRVKVIFRDRYGHEAAIVFHVAAGVIDPNSATVQAIVTALNNCVNSRAVQIELSQVASISATATAAAVYVNQDKAQFNGLDGDAQAHVWKIPGPLASVFSSSDHETLILTAGPGNAYMLAVIAGAQGRGGSPILTINSGHRTMGKRLKK